MQGLTVELHPFQRQALRFMLDNEHRSGGHRDHFWYQLPLSPLQLLSAESNHKATLNSCQDHEKCDTYIASNVAHQSITLTIQLVCTHS